MLFLESVNGEYVETERRPSDEVRKVIEKDLSEVGVFLHTPGDGHHFLPSDMMMFCAGGMWFGSYDSSEGAVMACAEALCTLRGLDLESLWLTAYGDEEFFRPTDEHRSYCARAVTLADTAAIIADLDAINFHQLAGSLRDVVLGRV